MRTDARSIALLSALLATALLRPKKILVLSWVPVIFSATIYVLLYAFLGESVAIAPSWGFGLVVAAPLLVLAERRFRKPPPAF